MIFGKAGRWEPPTEGLETLHWLCPTHSVERRAGLDTYTVGWTLIVWTLRVLLDTYCLGWTLKVWLDTNSVVRHS